MCEDLRNMGGNLYSFLQQKPTISFLSTKFNQLNASEQWKNVVKL